MHQTSNEDGALTWLHSGGRVIGIMAVFALLMGVAAFQIYESLACVRFSEKSKS